MIFDGNVDLINRLPLAFVFQTNTTPRSSLGHHDSASDPLCVTHPDSVRVRHISSSPHDDDSQHQDQFQFVSPAVVRDSHHHHNHHNNNNLHHTRLPDPQHPLLDPSDDHNSNDDIIDPEFFDFLPAPSNMSATTTDTGLTVRTNGLGGMSPPAMTSTMAMTDMDINIDNNNNSSSVSVFDLAPVSPTSLAATRASMVSLPMPALAEPAVTASTATAGAPLSRRKKQKQRKSSKTRKTPSDLAPFLTKTFGFVSEASTDGLVSWTADGTSFYIHDADTFALQLLPLHFKSNKLKSFVRQLNKYGFSKVNVKANAPRGLLEFMHPAFVRDRPDLLARITAKDGTASACGSGSKRTRSAEIAQLNAEVEASTAAVDAMRTRLTSMEGLLTAAVRDQQLMTDSVREIRDRNETLSNQLSAILTHLTATLAVAPVPPAPPSSTTTTTTTSMANSVATVPTTPPPTNATTSLLDSALPPLSFDLDMSDLIFDDEPVAKRQKTTATTVVMADDGHHAALPTSFFSRGAFA